MNFLQICQMTARESSVISGTQPASVVGQTGKLGKLVNWCSDAWADIQLLNPDWFWMQGEFSSTPGAIAAGGTGRYTAAALGVTTRFGDWIRDKQLPDNTIYRSLTIYDPAIGLSDEGSLTEISWETWRVKYGRGLQTANRPLEWAVSPARELCLGPIPDAPAYIIKGPYLKSAQILAANTDIPECPDFFHRIIAWGGLILMVRHDEAPADVLAGAVEQYSNLLAAMQRHELEDMTLAGNPVA